MLKSNKRKIKKTNENIEKVEEEEATKVKSHVYLTMNK